MEWFDQKENHLKILHEASGWKLKELEHLAFLKRVMHNIDPEHVINFKRWEDAINITYRHMQRFIESATRGKQQFTPLLYDQVLELIKFCLQESTDFIQFCRQMKTASKAVKENPAVQESIDHVIQQSDHFIGFAQTILYARK